jgi:hypothetical protein
MLGAVRRSRGTGQARELRRATRQGELPDALEAPVQSWSQNDAPDVPEGAGSRQHSAIAWLSKTAKKFAVFLRCEMSFMAHHDMLRCGRRRSLSGQSGLS